jgi:hypothetical protein
LGDLKDAGTRLVLPLAVVNEQLFVAGESNLVGRLDLRTGAFEQEKGVDRGEISLYPDPAGKSVFYASHASGNSGNTNFFGRINPVSFERTVLAAFTNNLVEGSFLAYDSEGKRLAFGDEGEAGAARFVLLENGVEVFSRPFTNHTKVSFGSAVLSPRGDLLLASYRQAVAGTNRADFGLMEIPLNKGPIRQTPIVSNLESKEDMSAFYWQLGLSHDGSTVALASTWISAAGDKPDPEKCGLYFVDLKSPSRKVTRVPVPIPKQLMQSQ